MLKQIKKYTTEEDGIVEIKPSSEDSLLILTFAQSKNNIKIFDRNFNALFQYESEETIKIILFNRDRLAFSENNCHFKSYFIEKNKYNFLNDQAYDLIYATNEKNFVSDYENKFTGLLEKGIFIWKQALVYLPYFNEKNNLIFGFREYDNNWAILKDKFSCYSLLDGVFLWSCSVSELGKSYNIADKQWRDGAVNVFLGIYNDVLWVLLTNAVIIGVDIKTGKIIHEIKQPVQSPFEFGKLEDKGYNFWYNYNNFLDEQQGKTLSLLYSGYSDKQFNYYYEIDLNTSHPELIVSEIKNITDIPFKIDGNPCPIWPYDSEYVYLCNYRDYKLALFNRKTKQIDWVHQMEVDPANKSFIIQMKVQGNRWYVLDNSKTLYVYERE